MLVESVKTPLATAPAASNLASTEPVFCEEAKAASTLVLNAVAAAPYVASAAMPAKSFNKETIFAPLAEPAAVN